MLLSDIGSLFYIGGTDRVGTCMCMGGIFIKNHCGRNFLSKILFFSATDLNIRMMWMLNTEAVVFWHSEEALDFLYWFWLG